MKTIYLDMDGVVADFDLFVKKFLNTENTTHSWPEEQWQKIASNDRLYRDLEKTPEADALVHVCRTLRDKFNWRLMFLTAVPKDNDMHWAFYDKILWAQTHYPDIPVHFGPYSYLKWQHCKQGDVLIDDRPSNCDEWKAAGGYSILHKGNLQETLNNLQKII